MRIYIDEAGPFCAVEIIAPVILACSPPDHSSRDRKGPVRRIADNAESAISASLRNMASCRKMRGADALLVANVRRDPYICALA